MTPQDKIKALAELDGRTLIGDANGLVIERIDGISCAPRQVPYLTSYDAIIPLIQKQTDQIRQAFFYELMEVHGLPKLPCGELGVQINITHLQFANLLVSTPTQLADALLIATGKMKE